MSGEEVNGEAVPQDSRTSEAFLHEDLAVEIPERAADRERAEVDLDERVPTEDGQSGTAEGQQVARATRIEKGEVSSMGNCRL